MLLLTYFGGAAFYLGHFGAAAAVGLLLVKLQILQALGQGQFLLDGHTEEGVQRLFLVLRCCQLPLHLIQLGDVLVASLQGENSDQVGGKDLEQAMQSLIYFKLQGAADT